MFWAGLIDLNWRGCRQSSRAIDFIIDGCLPFLALARGLEQSLQRVPLSYSMGPTIIDLLSDATLKTRVAEGIRDRVVHLESAWRDADPNVRDIIADDIDRYRRLGQLYRDIDESVIDAFGQLHRQSGLEILTAGATAAHLPGLISVPGALRAHFEESMHSFERVFSFQPKGIHLSRSGFMPSFEPLIVEQGLQYVVVDSRAFHNASARVVHDVYAPLHTPNCGLAVIATDPHSMRQPASRKRRFHQAYRDLSTYPRLTSTRTADGIGLSRYGADDGYPIRYDLSRAENTAVAQADAYVQGRQKHGAALHQHMQRAPLMVADFDIMSMATTWREAPSFIARVVQSMHHSPKMTASSLGAYLDEHKENQAAWPGPVIDSTPADEVADWRLPRLYEAAQAFRMATQQTQSPSDTKIMTARTALLRACALPCAVDSSAEEWSDQISRFRTHIQTVLNACDSNEISGEVVEVARHVARDEHTSAVQSDSIESEQH